MREIKFRAWDKSINKMHYLPNMGICYEYSHLSFEANSGDLDGICQWPEGDDSDIEGQIIMQYTGLKDNNGKEIYEGDIVNHLYHHQKAVIEWINCGLMMKYFNGFKDSMFAIDMEHIEIIGNIYENPELLNRHC